MKIKPGPSFSSMQSLEGCYRKPASAAERISYTIEQAVEVTGLSRSRLYVSINDGSLRSFLAGRRRMVSRAALEEYIAKLEAKK